MQKPQSEFVTVKRFAELAGVSTQAVYKRINSDLQQFVRIDGTTKTVDTKALRYFGPQDIQEIVNQEQAITRDMFDFLKQQLEVVNKKVFIQDEQIALLLEQLKLQTEISAKLQEEKQILTGELQEQKLLAESAPTDQAKRWWQFWKKTTQ